MKNINYYVADFETTVTGEEVQDSTEVWSSAITRLYDDSEYVKVENNINDFMNYVFSLPNGSVIYFHNLKFDGSFIMDWLMKNEELRLCYDNDIKDFKKDKFMPNMSYKVCISDMGIWYYIVVKYKSRLYTFRDSLKLLPFALKKIGKDFKTKHQKLEIDYVGTRHAYGYISHQEKEYIKNDVLVIKEALEIMFSEGHTKLTIGSCCMNEFKKSIKGLYEYDVMFPDLTVIPTDIPYQSDCDTYIRRSYKGAWCYLKEDKENIIITNGETYDVNSLYPSMMHSISGNRFPVGKPHFWIGNYIPDTALLDSKYYFIRVKTSFKLKDKHLPFIQIKGSYLYKGNEMLKTSTYVQNGVEYENIVEMTLTMTDYNLIKEHYELYNFEIIDGCWFDAIVGIFDNYINKYMEIKVNNKGAIKQIAKLFLNNLYGKFATSPYNSFKVPYLENNKVCYEVVHGYDKIGGYIPVGSAITSYARNFTIRSAQQNYDSFIYADTDSIHISGCNVKGIEIHPTRFCCWKNETSWDNGIFIRQKTYVEHAVKEDSELIEKPYYNVKCAGMNERCKNLFLKSMGVNIDVKNLNKKELKFLLKKRTLKDFCHGLKIPGKLLPKCVNGGTILFDTTFEMR